MTTLELFYVLQTCGIEKGIFNFTKEKCFHFYNARKRCDSHEHMAESTSEPFAGLIVVTKPNLSTLVLFS